MILIAVLWTVYLSERYVRWRPGDWVFRRTMRRAVCGVASPDLTFMAERFAFVWTSIWPADVALRCRGDAMDGAAFSATFATVGQQTRWLRASAASLFIALLVAFPLLVLSDRLLPLLPMFAAAVFLTWTNALLAFFRTYRRVHGERPPMETWLTHALSPVSLISAPTVVMLDVFRDSHPVAAASVLCSDREFLRIARLWHFDAPARRGDIERLAADRGLLSEILSPPRVNEPGVSCFCPRCHATYVSGALICADCVGVALSVLKTAESSVESAVRNDQQTTSSRPSGIPYVRSRDGGHSDRRSRQRPRHPRGSHRRKAS